MGPLKPKAKAKGMTFDRFVQRVHALPPELFTDIRDKVFYETPSKRFIDRSIRPPPQLSVNRATRSEFAKGYYGNGSHFEFSGGDKRTLVKWLISVDPKHRRLIGRRCLCYEVGLRLPYNPGPKFYADFSSYLQEDVVEYILPRLEAAGVKLKDNKLMISSSWYCEWGDGTREKLTRLKGYVGSGGRDCGWMFDLERVENRSEGGEV